MITIDDYVAGLDIPEHVKPLVVYKLKSEGYRRYDKYRWQQIENIIESVERESHE